MTHLLHTTADAVETLFAKADGGETTAPLSVFWLLTNACNLKCGFCFAASGKRAPDEMTTQEIKTTLDDFARAGLGYVGLLGGEPLLRPDIYEIIEHTSDLGLSPTMITNATLLDQPAIKRLRDVGLELFGTSMDGLDPAVHDRLRGVSGALERTKRAIGWAIEEGIRCSVRTVITPENADQIPALFDWELSMGVHEMILLAEAPSGRANGLTAKENREKAQAVKSIYTKTLRALRERAAAHGIRVPEPHTDRHIGVLLRPSKREDSNLESAGYDSVMLRGFERCRGCVIGRYLVSPQPNGDVYPCPFLPIRIGNLRTHKIDDIWTSSELLRRVRKRELNGPCGTCEIRYECGGCRARAYALTGDPYASDPLCPRVMANSAATHVPSTEHVRCVAAEQTDADCQG